MKARIPLVDAECYAGDTPDVIIVSGPSGAGKGSVVTEAMVEFRETEPGRILSTSWTTRGKRGSEPSSAYNFVSRQEFEARIHAGGFLEYAEVFGEYYGTPIPDADKNILEIDVQGALTVKDRAERLGILSTHLFVFVVTDLPGTLSERLFRREDGISELKKLKRFRDFYTLELPLARQLGAHVIVNNSLPHAVANFLAATHGTYFCDDKLDEVIKTHEDFDLTEINERIAAYSE